MQVNNSNFQTVWARYAEKCKTEVTLSSRNGTWVRPSGSKNIYVIEPDPSNFNQGKAKSGPMSLTEFSTYLQQLHSRYNAQNYFMMLHHLNESISQIPYDTPVLVTLAYLISNNQNLIFGTAFAVLNLFPKPVTDLNL